jgi:hypothetical protein
MVEAIKGTCEFEVLDTRDILSAIQTLSGCPGRGLKHTRLGAGFERFLQWAIVDINAAAQDTAPESQARLATNAVMNARRALSCLVDQYLVRDGFASCKNPPSRTEDKMSVLLARKVFDDLTSNVLERAVGKRNRAEHEYYALSLSEGQDIVELVRRTVQSVTAHSKPYPGPCHFGIIHCQTLSNAIRKEFQFLGWSGPSVIFATFCRPAWIGIILPESKERAVVRRAWLQDIEAELLVDILSLLAQNFERDYHGSDSSEDWKKLAMEAGLLV